MQPLGGEAAAARPAAAEHANRRSLRFRGKGRVAAGTAKSGNQEEARSGICTEPVTHSITRSSPCSIGRAMMSGSS